MNIETYACVHFILSKSTRELWYRKRDVPGHHMIAGAPRCTIQEICCLYQFICLSF